MGFPPFQMPTWAPGTEAAAVVTSDTQPLALAPTKGGACRGLYVGTGGDVKVDMLDGGTGVVFKAVPTGTFMPIQPSRVYTTGTTATNIVALY